MYGADIDNLPEDSMYHALQAILHYAWNGESERIKPTGTYCVPFNIDLTPAQAAQVRDIKHEVWEISALLLQSLGHLHINGFISQYGCECPASFSPGDVSTQVVWAKEAMVRLETAVDKLCELTDAEPLKKGAVEAPPAPPKEN
jgi:hypothetical protein